LTVLRFNGFSKIFCGLSTANTQRGNRQNPLLHRPTNSERFCCGKRAKSAMQLNRTSTECTEIGRHSWWFDCLDRGASMTSARFAYKRGPAFWRHSHSLLCVTDDWCARFSPYYVLCLRRKSTNPTPTRCLMQLQLQQPR